MAEGQFITLEGGEGAGKSTQAEALAHALESLGYETVLTREPGGSKQAEKIREVLLSGKAARYGPFGEAVLFANARDDHLEKTILPALEAGKWVICDRFMDSTTAYQGAGGGISRDVLSALEEVVVGENRPDLTIILDIPAEQGLKRVKARETAAGAKGGLDRFEKMDLGFHQRLRDSFLEIARKEPARCVVIDATQAPEEVEKDVWRVVTERLKP